MGTTRRDFLAAAGTAAGATVSPDFLHAQTHDHQDVPSDVALRVKSLESLLVEKGLVDPAAIDAIVDNFEHKVGPRNGARVVARAWADPAYKQRLLEDGTKAIAELGYSGFEGAHMVVVENTRSSTTSWFARCDPAIRGRLSVFRRSGTNRRRTVLVRLSSREVCCASSGLNEDVEVRVWDSTAEVRYLILPERPPGTETLSEDALAALVTRDSMIGVAKAVSPGRGGKL
jgi:nitrile hydratase subunit alpha